MNDFEITHSPISIGHEKLPDELQNKLSDLYFQLGKNRPVIRKKLEKLIKHHPELPVLLNYLVTYYYASGDLGRAEQVNNELCEKFPDYLFGVVNKARFFIVMDKEDEAYDLLGGGNLNLSELYPERKVFHISEFKAYSSTAVMYLAATGQLAEARDYIRRVAEKHAEEKFIDSLNEIVIEIILKKGREKDGMFFQEDGAEERLDPTVDQEEGDLLPKDKSFSYLYDSDLWEVDLETLAADITSRKEDLINECHYVLQRAPHILEWAYQEDYSTPAVLHAALILGYLDPKQGFEEFLLLLRQPADLSEIFFNEWSMDVLERYFFFPTDEFLSLVKDFIAEPLGPVYAKNGLIELLRFSVINDKSYLPKITHLIEELMLLFREERDNEALMDAGILGFMVGTAIDIKAVELLPLIEQLYDEELISEEVEGDFEDVKKNMFKEDDARYRKMYDNVIEHFKALKNYLVRNGGMSENSFDDDGFDNSIENNGHYDSDKILKSSVEEATTISFAGTPLNAPCPCGSGKKYKRCHGKK